MIRVCSLMRTSRFASRAGEALWVRGPSDGGFGGPPGGGGVPGAGAAGLELLTALEAIAERHGVTAAQLAIAWVASRGEDIIPLIGTKRRDRLAEALKALDLTLAACGLGREGEGRVLRIAPAARLTEESAARRRLLARRGRCGLGRRDTLGEREDVLRDLAIPVADDKRNSAIDGEHQRPAVGDDRVRDLAPQARLDVRCLDASGAVVAVGHELHLRLVVSELLDNFHEDADVLQAGDLERHEGQDHVGDVEHRDHLLLERRPGVHHDVGIALPEKLEDVLDVRAGDELGRFRGRRREHHLDAGRVLDEDRLHHVGVGCLERPDEVGDRLRLWTHVEDHGDVPERQAAVHQNDGLARQLVQRHREVRGDRRPANTALRREERDDLAHLATGCRRCRGSAGRGDRSHGRVACAAHLLQLVDVADRVDELVGREGLHEEFARTGEHRAAQVILLALDAHHDDRRLGDGVRDDLGGGDPVHVGHVYVHQDHVRPVLLGEVDGLLPTTGGGSDLHIGLEPDQLGEVLSRVGDVVDDEDADLFAVSQASSLPFAVFARV